MKACASEQNIKLALMFYCERSQVSITRSVVKACENIKLALMFYCERSQVSITRSVVKACENKACLCFYNECSRYSTELRLKT